MLGPPLDAVVRWVARIEPTLFALAGPLQTLTKPYIRAGLSQKWNMFSNPDIEAQYVRLAYYVRSRSSSRPRIVKELVFPADPEDGVRVLHDYRDKAVVNAQMAFSLARTKQSGQTPALAISPLVGFFRRRFAASLAPDDTIVRTELWYGSAPMPPRGERLADETLQARLAVLHSYYDGPVPVILGSQDFPTVGIEEREADIVWRLEFIDED
jgi:hypothetical protein